MCWEDFLYVKLMIREALYLNYESKKVFFFFLFYA